MAHATPVHHRNAGASFTKAVMVLGLRQSQQQCRRMSIWALKPVAGCLA
jgi:hypothetical protein